MIVTLKHLSYFHNKENGAYLRIYNIMLLVVASLSFYMGESFQDFS